MAGPEGRVCKLCRFALGICQTGYRKVHERADPQCRLHGVEGRATQVKTAPRSEGTPPPRGEMPAAASTGPPQADKVLFRTRRGLHLQYNPEPHIDRWMNSELKFDAEQGGFVKPSGKGLNASERSTYARYRRRHRERCQMGDLADKLTRMVDKYLPRVADESRVYIMRFPEKIPDLLRRVRKIRRKLKVTRQAGDTETKTKVQTSPKRQRHEKKESKAGRPTLKPRGVQAEQHATREQDDDRESPPDWGGDDADDAVDQEEAATLETTMTSNAKEDDSAATWPWGERGRPSDRGESVGVLAQRPNLPTTPRRQDTPEGGTLLQAVHMVQAHMAQQRGRTRATSSRSEL